MRKSILRLSLLLAASCACSPLPNIIWREGAPGPDGKSCHAIIIHNASSVVGDWNIWFAQNPAPISVLVGSDANLEEVQATLHRISPIDSRVRDSIVIRYISDPLCRRSWAPEGFVLSRGKKVRKLRTDYSFLPVCPDTSCVFDPVAVSMLDIIPSVKCPAFYGGTVKSTKIMESSIEGQRAGWYRIVADEDILIESADEDGAFYGRNTLNKILESSNSQALPRFTVEDWPDMGYRGFMLDVARNFIPKNDVLQLVDILSRYKVNYLHLHLTDDEGWRFAVNGIDELTSFGAFHALPVHCKDGEWKEVDALQPSYDGCADTRDVKSTANGFFSRSDFIEILRYCDERRIKVIPEIDMPGHCRAAIKSMEAYERRTGDASMRLSDPDDRSSYRSAQGYDDNAMCVALPSVYNFIGRIMDCIKDIYSEAGVELPAIHVGGDEVAGGAWSQSPSCLKFMRDNGMTSREELRCYFIRKVAELALERNVRIGCWQEMIGGLDVATHEAVRKVIFGVNCWNVSDGYAHDRAVEGWPVIISDARYTYADQAYSSSKLERGHSWCRYIDGKVAWELSVPSDDCDVLGVQAQLFTETVRGFNDITYLVFPKMLGVFDRAWNSIPKADYNVFRSIVYSHEFPYYDKLGIEYKR